MKKNIQILNPKEIEQKINRLAWEIYENNIEEKEIIIIGLADRGIIIAEKITKYLTEISSLQVLLGEIILNKNNPLKEIHFTLEESQINNKVVILVDDVLKSGRTLIYAARYLLNTSLKKLSTVVLIDRKHNNYPIKADFSGLSLSTTLQEYVKVELHGNNRGAYLS